MSSRSVASFEELLISSSMNSSVTLLITAGVWDESLPMFLSFWIIFFTLGYVRGTAGRLMIDFFFISPAFINGWLLS